jgi:hypothetical protein
MKGGRNWTVKGRPHCTVKGRPQLKLSKEGRSISRTSEQSATLEEKRVSVSGKVRGEVSIYSFRLGLGL